MSVPRLSPEDWGRATAATTADAFARRVQWCRDAERLQAAAAHEAERWQETRQQRVARLNQRLQEVRG